MKKANEDLEEEIAADPEAAAKYNIENVDGDEKVVEMVSSFLNFQNVNVGVLEEKKDGEEEALDLKLPGGEKSEKPLVEPLDDEEEDAIEEEEEEEEEVSEYSEDEEEEDEDVYSESD